MTGGDGGWVMGHEGSGGAGQGGIRGVGWRVGGGRGLRKWRVEKGGGSPTLVAGCIGGGGSPLVPAA